MSYSMCVIYVQCCDGTNAKPLRAVCAGIEAALGKKAALAHPTYARAVSDQAAAVYAASQTIFNTSLLSVFLCVCDIFEYFQYTRIPSSGEDLFPFFSCLTINSVEQMTNMASTAASESEIVSVSPQCRYMSKSPAEAVEGFERARRCYSAALAAIQDADGDGDDALPDRRRQVEAEAANTQLNLATALLHASSSASEV